MTLDGRISEGWGSFALVALLVWWYVTTFRRYRFVLRREHLLDPKGMLVATPWNFLSTKKWTPAGIAFHKQYLRHCILSALLFLVCWLVLDAIF
jgi:hypothetical protein